jgi:hypothetical protein
MDLYKIQNCFNKNESCVVNNIWESKSTLYIKMKKTYFDKYNGLAYNETNITRSGGYIFFPRDNLSQWLKNIGCDMLIIHQNQDIKKWYILMIHSKSKHRKCEFPGGYIRDSPNYINRTVVQGGKAEVSEESGLSIRDKTVEILNTRTKKYYNCVCIVEKDLNATIGKITTNEMIPTWDWNHILMNNSIYAPNTNYSRWVNLDFVNNNKHNRNMFSISVCGHIDNINIFLAQNRSPINNDMNPKDPNIGHTSHSSVGILRKM